MVMSKITSVLCIVQEDKSSWSHGLVKKLSKITSVLCNVHEDKSSWSQGLVKDNKCTLQRRRTRVAGLMDLSKDCQR